MTKAISKAASKEDDVLVGFARKVGTALGVVAAKLGPDNKPVRRTARKSRRSKPAIAAANKRLATKLRLQAQARRSKAKR